MVPRPGRKTFDTGIEGGDFLDTDTVVNALVQATAAATGAAAAAVVCAAAVICAAAAFFVLVLTLS
jgi:hypothetical protein